MRYLGTTHIFFKQATYTNKWLYVFVCMLCTSITHAQRIATTLDRDKILLGQQITWKLRVADVNKTKNPLGKWFNIPDTFNHIEVVERTKIDTIDMGSVTTYEQEFKFTSFDSGAWTVPVFTAPLADGSVLKTDSFTISVLPVDVSDMADYHDIKEIVEVDSSSNWLVTAALMVATIVSLIALGWLLSKKLKAVKQQPKKMPSNFTPLQWALEQIKLLQEKDLPAKQQYKQYYTELVGICRSFSDTQLGTDTSTKTTDEYMLSVKGLVGNEPVQTQYFQLLRLADAIKFAKFVPEYWENTNAIDTAVSFIKTIHQYYNKS